MTLPPLQYGETRHCSGFEGLWNYPQGSGTRPIAILRTYSALLAGLARLPYPSFLFWNAAGGCLWALTFGWLGATFGSQWPLVARWAGRVGVLIVGLLVLVGMAVLLGRYRRGHAQIDTAPVRTSSSVPPLPRKSQ